MPGPAQGSIDHQLLHLQTVLIPELELCRSSIQAIGFSQCPLSTSSALPTCVPFASTRRPGAAAKKAAAEPPSKSVAPSVGTVTPRMVSCGDSALEAACSIAETGDTRITLSYRSRAFTRAKANNRDRIQTTADAGHLEIAMASQVAAIESEHVELMQGDSALRLRNEAVITSAGGILPNDFLRSIGIEVETKFGIA
jgi:hypothetical protein